ncbi:MAG: ATP-dependent helicase [Betaproteobacteria bacterium]|nr:ATP-dependent helicase [Rubrivivax sp.]
MAPVLTVEQQAAVAHGDTPLLVVAGAGSGKTTMLSARLAELVRRGADPQRILLLSFSRRSAHELAERAAARLHAALGLPATTPAPRLPWCGTFHGVAARLLRDEAAALGLAPGFSVLDAADAEELMAQQRLALGLAARSVAEHRVPTPAACLAIHSRCVGTGQPLAEVLRRHFPWCRAPGDESGRALAGLFQAYGAAKLQQRLLDYDDLLDAWRLALDHEPVASRLRARFDHVLVDEVQDLNPLQWRIVEALRPAGAGLTAVGDDAQAIYGFRGAAVAGMLGFPARCTPAARVLALTRNHRSTPEIVAAGNAVIAQARERFAKTLTSPRPPGARPTLHLVPDEAAEARGVARAVLEAREGGLALRRQAVLFRTATHSQALELELLRRRVPYVKFGGLRFLEAAHVKDVLAVLRWADNPAAALAAQRVARLVPGIGPAALQRFAAVGHDLAAFEPPRTAAAPWQALRALMAALRGPQARWPDDLARVLAWYEPHLQRLHADAAQRATELQQLAASAARQRDRLAFVTELLLEPPAAHGAEAGRPLLDDDWLTLSTLHSAKGQEWSAVHVLRVVDGAIPSDLATGHADEIDEERRLLYVGMSRARDTLALWAPQNFHVTQQRAWGGRHVTALRSRFIDDAVMATLEAVLPSPDAEDAGDSPSTVADAAPATPAAAAEPSEPGGLLAELARQRRAGWAQ